jgi:putative polyketide hydroxylase
MAKRHSHFQVLIVGGGIVGLSASLFLSRQGINSLLVERHPGTSIHPRARGVNARTMELYREVGVDEAVRQAGASLSLSRGLFKGSALREVIESQTREENVATRRLPLAEYFESISPTEGTRGTQDMIEPVLLAAAREQGGDLRFNVECIGFEQDDSGVRATLRQRSDNSESTIVADYVIAADGADSFVRGKLGASTTGAGTLGYLLNILFEADLNELVRGREFSMCLIEQPEVRGLFTSINNSNRWVFHLSYDPGKGEKTEDFPPQRCQELVKLALGLPDIDVEIKSVLPWEPTVRVAEKFQHGRVFLAGDAAHQMPPWGGQGANTGIADVHNLAWKLAAVLHGQATAALLATYDAERFPVGRLVAEESGAAADEHGLFSMNKSLPMILALVRRIPRIAGYGYTYTSQAINTEDTTPLLWRLSQLLKPLPWILGLCGTAGTRAPHIWVHLKAQRISTLDLFGKGFVLLAGQEGNEWCTAAPTIASSVGVDLVAYCAGPADDLVCSKGQWESSAGISTRGALLVRPDGFVAWRAWGQPRDVHQRLTEELKHAICR